MSDMVTGPAGEAPDAELPRRSTPDLSQWFVVALLAGTVLRIAASLIAGIVRWSQGSDPFSGGTKHRAGFVILDFTEFGDGVGALLTVVIAASLYSYVRTHTDWFDGRLLALTATAVAAFTALASLVSMGGYALYLSGSERTSAAMVGYAGRGLAYAVIAAAGAVAAYRLTWQIDEQLATSAPDTEVDAETDADGL